MMFTPASTRATLARLGVKSTYELGNGETFELGPKQMPSEAEWRADWLSWQRDLLYVTLVDTPEESRQAKAQLHYRLLVNEIGLHPYEAMAVVGWAMNEAKATMTFHAGSPRGPLMHMKGLELRKIFLDRRLAEMLRKHATGPNAAVDSSTSGQRQRPSRARTARQPSVDST